MNCKFLISVCLLICLAGCDAFSRTETAAEISAPAFRYEEIPEYSGEAYVTPGELDELGRCTDVEAVVGPETLPQTSRESIGDMSHAVYAIRDSFAKSNKYKFSIL